MQLRSGATYASMSSRNTSNNQDAATIRLKEISATQHSHQDAIIQLNSKLDEIMKLLEKSQEKRPNRRQVDRTKSGTNKEVECLSKMMM